MNKSPSPNGVNGNGRDADGRFTTGNPGGPGRPKGAMGRSNREIVEAIIETFHLGGGIEYLKGLNDADFVKLVSVNLAGGVLNKGSSG